MPDNALADGDVLTSSFYTTNVREQVVATVTSSTRPTGVEGRLIYETDTNLLRLYDGTSWRIVAGGDWESYTPAWSGLTLGNGTHAGCEYKYGPQVMYVRGQLTFGSTTSISGAVTQTIPNSATSRTGGNDAHVGMAVLVDTGSATRNGVIGCGGAATSVSFNAWQVSGSNINNSALSSTVPHTWTTTDVIRWFYTVPI